MPGNAAYPNRYGKFAVSHDMITHEPMMVAEMFSKMNFIPTRAESMMHTNEVEYVELSPMFEEVPGGQAAPEYEIEATWTTLSGGCNIEQITEAGMSLEVSKK